MVLCENEAKYLKSIHFSDSIVCLSCINKVLGSKITFSHKIMSSNNSECFIRGKSSVVLLKNGKLMLEYPEEMEQLIIRYVKEVQGGLGEE